MRISYTAINQYQNCPRKWKLLQENPYQSNDDVEVGTLVHKALELMLRLGISNREALVSAYHGQNWFVFARALNLLSRFNLPPQDLIALEENFEIPLGDHTLVGVIDRIEKIDDQEVITDYKTSGYIPPKYELEVDLQPTIYMLARPGAKFRYYYLQHDLTIWIDKTEEELELAKDFIQMTADHMEKDTVCEPRLNKWCPSCQFRYDCSLFLNSHLNISSYDLIARWEEVKQARRFLEAQEEDLKNQILARISAEGQIKYNGKVYTAEPRKRREYDFEQILPILQERNLLDACYVKISELPSDPDLWEEMSKAERINYLGMEIKVGKE